MSTEWSVRVNWILLFGGIVQFFSILAFCLTVLLIAKGGVERAVEVPNCNFGFISFSYQFLTHVY